MAGLDSSMANHGELTGEGKGRRERSRGDVLLTAGVKEGGMHCWLHREEAGAPSKELQKGIGPLCSFSTCRLTVVCVR
jgi:hypothetical protein